MAGKKKRQDGSLFQTRVEATMAQDAKSSEPAGRAAKSDITRQKQAEEAVRESEQNYRRLAAYHNRLNDISIVFAEASNTEDLFNKIGETFRLLTGAIAASFQVYDKKTRALQIVSLSIDQILRDKLDSTFEPEFFEMQMHVSEDLEELMISQFISKPKDLCELTLGTMPQELSDQFMDTIGCQQIVALAITYGKELVGTCIAYLRGDQPVVPDDALRTYTYIAGLAIKRRRAEEALRESEEQYRLLAEHTADFVWLMDMNLKPTYQSPSAEKLTGFTHQEIMELPLEKRVTPESLKIAAEVFLHEIPRVESDPDYNPTLKLELEIYRGDGTTLWSENIFSVIRDASGRPISILGEARDITKRKKAEEALKASGAQYRLLAEHTTDGVLLLDMNLRIIYVSPNVKTIRGFTVLEAMEMPLEKHITPESLKLAAELFLEELPMVVANPDYNPVRTLEIEYYRKDRTTLWTESKFSVIRDPGGKPVSILGESRDITERKLAEQALSHSERLLSNIIEKSPTAMWISDSSGTLIRLNQTCRDLLNITADEVIGKYNIFEDNIVEEQGFMPLVRDVFEKGATVKFTLEYDSAQLKGLPLQRTAYLILEITISAVKDANDEITNAVIQQVDITERKLAEQALRESEALLRATGEMAKVGGWEIDVETLKVNWTEETHRIHELPLEHKPPLEEAINYFHPEERQKLSDSIQRALKYGEAYDMEMRFITAKGKHLWVRTVCFPQVVDGKTVRLRGTFQDITKRKLAEESLRREQIMLARTEGIAHVGSWEWNIATDTVTWSDELFRIFQRDPQEGAPSFAEHPAFYHPDDMARLQQAVKVAVANGTPYELELRAIRKDGMIRVCMARGVAEMAPCGRPIRLFGSLQDITERKVAEEKLAERTLQLEKSNKELRSALADKDVLLKEVHHRVKNNLMVISSLLNLQMRHTPDETTRALLRENDTRIMSMATIHEQVLRSGEYTAIDCVLYINDLVSNLRNSLAPYNKDIRLTVDIQPGITIGINQAVNLGLIINELVSNSFKHAFPDREKGEINISCRRYEDQIELSVSDNGTGMPDTVDTEQPSTLGLQLVNILVKQLDGTIKYERDNGSKFTLVFRTKARSIKEVQEYAR